MASPCSRVGSAPPGSSTASSGRSAADVTVIGNVADDVELLGLHVSPDLDTCSTRWPAWSTPCAAGASRTTARTRWRRRRPARGCGLVPARGPGHRPAPGSHGAAACAASRCRRSRPTSARASASELRLLPATDDRLRTLRDDRCRRDRLPDVLRRPPRRARVRALRFEGDSRARPGPGVLEADRGRGRGRRRSVQPVPLDRPHPRGCRRAGRGRCPHRADVVAVSPIIGGRAIKGPADACSARSPARRARGRSPRLRRLPHPHLLDTADASLVPAIEALGVRRRRRTAHARPRPPGGRRRAGLALAADMLAR